MKRFSTIFLCQFVHLNICSTRN